MQDSRIAHLWEKKGFEIGFKIGFKIGSLAGKIQAFQEVLKQPVTPLQDLGKLPEQELAALLAQLRHQVFPKGD